MKRYQPCPATEGASARAWCTTPMSGDAADRAVECELDPTCASTAVMVIALPIAGLGCRPDFEFGGPMSRPR